MNTPIEIDKINIEYPKDIYEIMQVVLKEVDKMDQDKEHLWVLALSSANQILNLELVALGTYNRVNAKPADILAIPLQKQAKGVILVHNHPSGSIMPSEGDKEFTNKMIQACRLMNTPVLDHVIITENSYFSFDKSGLLKDLEGRNAHIPPYELEKMSYIGGREEREAEIAKDMIEDGEPMEKIKKWTGLSEKRITELLNTPRESI